MYPPTLILSHTFFHKNNMIVEKQKHSRGSPTGVFPAVSLSLFTFKKQVSLRRNYCLCHHPYCSAHTRGCLHHTQIFTHTHTVKTAYLSPFALHLFYREACVCMCVFFLSQSLFTFSIFTINQMNNLHHFCWSYGSEEATAYVIKQNRNQASLP